eukprot:6678368-Pyramimonas_sp.AAC.1
MAFVFSLVSALAAQDGLRGLPGLIRAALEAPKGGPRKPQDGPKTAPEKPQRGPKGPRTLWAGPRSRLRRPQEQPQRSPQ